MLDAEAQHRKELILLKQSLVYLMTQHQDHYWPLTAETVFISVMQDQNATIAAH